MSDRPNPECRWSETAALYAAGALSSAERAAFEQAMQHEPEAARALAEYGEVIAALAPDAPPCPSRGRVREALLRRIADTQQPVISRGDAAGWREIGIPGVRIRTLFLDRERNIHTFLMRCEPGAEVPDHPHAGPEECYVLSGSFETYGTILRAGDYMRAPAGSKHPASRSAEGCLVLLTVAIGDDVQAA